MVMFGSISYFLAHPQIAQRKSNMRAIFGLFANTYPKKNIPLKVCYLGLFCVGPINSLTLSFEKVVAQWLKRCLSQIALGFKHMKSYFIEGLFF